jgi:hypothetical protein
MPRTPRDLAREANEGRTEAAPAALLSAVWLGVAVAVMVVVGIALGLFYALT